MRRLILCVLIFAGLQAFELFGQSNVVCQQQRGYYVWQTLRDTMNRVYTEKCVKEDGSDSLWGTETLGLFPPYTVATLPATPKQRQMAWITDGKTATDTTVGGGTFQVYAVYIGTSWQAIAGGFGGGGSAGYPDIVPAMVGDCTTDDRAVLVTALAAAPVGATIRIPPPGGACYKLTAAIVITKPVHLLGATISYLGNGPTFSISSGSAYILDFENGSVGSSVHGIGFTSSASSLTAGGGIKLNNATAQADGSNSYNISGNSFYHLYNGIEAAKGNGITVEDNHFNLITNDGELIDGASMVRSVRNDILRCANSIEVTAVGGMEIDNDQWWGSVHGLYVDPPGGGGVYYISARNLISDWTSSDGVLLAGSGIIAGVDLDIHEINAYQDGTPTVGGYGVHVNNSLVDGVHIHGGSIRACLLGAVRVDAGKNVDVDNVTFSANGHGHAGGGTGFSVPANVSFFNVHDITCGATWTDDLDVGNQLSCVKVAAGASTGFSVRNIQVRGGSITSGIFNMAVLDMDAVTGFYNLDLPSGGNYVNGIGGSLTVGGWIVPSGTGTIAALGSTTFDLAAVLPTPATDTTWWTRGEFMITVGVPGSYSAARVEVIKTADGASASITSNIGNIGSGAISLSGTTLTLANASGSTTANYLITCHKVDSTL